ncbi:MAG TPA: tyrosine-type recombinase/integrase, partial [Acidobacteriaceae bacterium]|nr:tyrosine-type recombinase/integrase [Acidobacteriaceae bacterium]
PMSERVMDALLVRCAGKREGWMFPSPKAASGHAQIPEKAFREARERAGIDSRLVLYTCRHSFATYAMAQTGNAFAVGKAMGHANMQSMATYQHPELDAIREVIDRRNANQERVN